MAPYVPTSALVTSRDTSGRQAASDIAALTSGGYVVTWNDQSASGEGTVRARVYDANGRPTSGEIVVGSGNESSVAPLSGGGFAVALIQGGSNSSVPESAAVRLFSATGAAQTGIIALDSEISGISPDLGLPEITSLSDGRLLVAWRLGRGENGSHIVGGILSPDGEVLANSLQLSSTIFAQYGGFADLSVAPLENGGFMVASVAQTSSITAVSGTYNYGSAYVQSFGSDGRPITTVSTIQNGFVTPISTTALPDGRVAVAYNNESGRFVFRLVSFDGTASSERDIGIAGHEGFPYSRGAQGSIAVSTTADGNILAHYDLFIGQGTASHFINSEISEILSPNGDRLGLVSSSNPASQDKFDISSQFAVALLSGSVALVETSGVYNHADVLTRVYQPAAVTSDPDDTPLVNDAFYIARNPDVAAAGIDPDQHYHQYGWKEGRNPDALFNSDAYRFANPDVAAANIDPLQHYDQSGWKEGRDPSASFDNEMYLFRNPDVRAAGIDPLLHYLQFGRDEGREASPAIGSSTSIIHGSFDAEYYLLSNPDVGRAAQAQGISTLAAVAEFAYNHYETYGWHEGRDPNAYFDVAGYQNAYADVRAANIDPLLHYDQYGWREGRDPSGLFDTTNYRANNSDVQTANVDPLTHFLKYGVFEGRMPLGDGSFE